MSGLTLIVKTITKLILGFILVYGAGVVVYGHVTPGGGFAGGVMMACALILLVLAFGKNAAFSVISEKTLSHWDVFAVVSVVEIFFIGFIGGPFVKNLFPHGTPMRIFSGGTVMWSNVGVGIKVAVFLFAVFMALATFRMTRER
ncbi:MAG: hypothetical protein J7M24_00540 [Candidatus Latescibacteria bacterium]|nr:hypothetical protein [Candidatus Latescibacterota bacterium]